MGAISNSSGSSYVTNRAGAACNGITRLEGPISSGITLN